MTLTAAPPTTSTSAHARRWPRRAAAIAVTTSVLVVTSAVITLGFDATLRGPAFGDSPPIQVGVGAVATATLLATLAGWVLLAALERWTTRPRTAWTTIAIATVGVSFVPLSGAGATTGDRVALAALHLLVATIYIPLMRDTIANHRGGHS